MTAMIASKVLAAAAATAIFLQPVATSAQPACVTEEEVGAIAVYSIPSVIEAVRLRCGAELSESGFLNRPNASQRTRYAALQTKVWPRAKSGLLKVLGARSGEAQAQQSLALIGGLPDDAVRPLVDALIVQELSPKIATSQCIRIERIIELASPIDPEIAGNILGAVAGIVRPKDLPICSARS